MEKKFLTTSLQFRNLICANFLYVRQFIGLPDLQSKWLLAKLPKPKQEHLLSILGFLSLVFQNVQAKVRRAQMAIMCVFTVLFSFFAIQSMAQGGIVFLDGNANGIKDASENGFGGVTIRAYSSSGVLTETQVSASTPFTEIGKFSFSSLVNGQPYRIEFDVPAGFFPTSSNTDSPTSVQFIIGRTTPNISFGIYDAGQCATERNPRLIAGCGRVFGSNISVASWRYDNRFTSANSAEIHPHQEDMTFGQVGIPFALDSKWDGARNLVFHSTIASKLTGVLPAPPAGNGAIYVSDYSNQSTGYAYQSNKLLVNLATLGLNTTAQFPVSTLANAETGEYGLGGIAVSDDGKKLFVVNLGKKNIVQLDISGIDYSVLPTTAPSSFTEINIPSSVTNPINGQFRPISLKMYAGSLYVGGVSDASGSTGTNSNFRVVVLKMDLATNTFTQVFSFNPTSFGAGSSAATNWAQVRWKSTFVGGGGNVDSGGFWDLGDGEFQPFINDIAFDDFGNMMIGITNRKVYSSLSNFDLGYVLRTYRAANGSFSLENNKVAGNITSTSREIGVAGNSNIPANHVEDTGGPGGNWFFEQGLPPLHYYLFSGGTYILPGTGELIAGYTDPLNVNALGARYLNTTTGRTDFGIHLGGQKAFAITGTTGLCNPNPIEIGNRVWIDTDNDGLQDAGENGLEGVVVQLIKSGNIIATATTDLNGNYIFSSASGTNTSSKIYGITQLVPDMEYTLHFPINFIVSGTSYNLTLPNQGSNDFIDSDAITSSGDVLILPSDLPSFGSNNHSFDVGYFGVACVKPNAGTDQSPTCVGNTPITSATLAATAVSGGGWSQALGNPAGAVVTTPASATSGITGLVPGVYQFIWSTSLTCSDTVKITIPNCTCVNPTATATAVNATCTGGTANSDASIKIAAFTAGQRYQYSPGGTFTAGSAIPAAITVIPSGGVIVNNLANVAATYTVRIYDATDAACFVDRVVNITVTNCTVPCVNPTATATAANATCTGGTANSDASITISAFTAGQRYQYSPGGTFTAGSAIPAAITVIPSGGVIVNNLANVAATYTVRIYDATDAACFVDRVVNITLVDCTTPCSSPNCGTVTVTKN